MSLGGFGLNPFADVAHLGNNIGSIFGSSTEASAKLPQIGQAVSALLPEPSANPMVITKVAQPRVLSANTNPTQNNATAGSYAPSGSTYYGSYGAPQAAPVDLNASYESLIKGALGRLPGELQTAENTVQNQFNTNNNQLDSAKAQTDATYGTTKNTIGQQYQTDKNQIQDQASQGLSSLMRLLGAHGAGGSSAALYTAPNAVANEAAQQNAGAGQTYGQNLQANDTSYNNYLQSYGDQKKQLNDWLTTQLNAAKTTSNNTEQGLQQQLLGLQPSVAAAQPYVDKINALASQADALQNFNPTYTGQTPVYTAPTVSSYEASAPQLQQSAGGIQGTLTPSLYTLLGLNQKDKNAKALA